MIISVENIKKYITTDLSDDRLKLKLDAMEHMVRAYTNNNFQNRSFRFEASISNDRIYGNHTHFAVGDTIQVSSRLNEGIYTISRIDGAGLDVDEELIDEPMALVTRIDYPQDIVYGVINLIDWDLRNRDKVGIKSENLSRYSVTYFDLDSNSKLSFPSSMIGFLKPYMKARF